MPFNKLISVNVSLPKEVTYKGKTVRTGIFKEAVSGRVKVKKLNLEGDGQADLIGHGGEMRAVYVYSYHNYPYWQDELERDDFAFGQFGENFTVEGMFDQEIHIGDQFKIGTALFEVSQPRVPCYKLAMKMGVPDFYSRILKSGRLGFYFRVLEEGEVGAGDEIIPVKVQDKDGMNITQVNELMYFDKQNYEEFERALTYKALSPGWANTFIDRLEKRAQEEALLKAYRPLKVIKIEDESDVIRSFYLSAQEDDLEMFQAGQFLPVKLDIPGQYQPVLRTYTISNASGANYYRLSIKREDVPIDVPNAYPGVSSNYFHQEVTIGTEILAAKPRGKFYLNAGTKPVVLVSGGVGITPMISMLEYLVKKEDSRSVYFIHGARNGKEHAFKNWIQEVGAAHLNIKSFIAYSKPLARDQKGADYQLEGRLSIDTIKHVLDGKLEADFYVCGPNTFMQDILSGLKKWGVAKGNIHFEVFNASAESASLSSFLQDESQASEGSSSEITVNFLDAGIEAPWDDAYESILEFAESKGLSPDFSCRAGVCQTCISEIKSGSVIYDPEPLQEPEEGKVLICCSKPRTNVQLKL